MGTTCTRKRAWANLWIITIALSCIALTAWADDEEKKPVRYPKTPSAENVKVVPETWSSAPRTPLVAGEIDALLLRSGKTENASPAKPILDEEFIRRLYLDVVGKLPSVESIQTFVASNDKQKRSKLIDELLASDDFARHWGRYLRDVLLWRATDMRIVARLPRTIAMEQWLTEQLKTNKSWAEIARALITADGALHQRHHAGGQNAFLLAHTGDDGPVERASDTSRVFMGIRIQCAQCHNHPDDIWKRQQFHELAAFFGRVGDESKRLDRNQPGGEIGGGVIQLVSLKDGEYQMPDQDDPKKTHTVHPRFLTGENVPQGLGDKERRRLLADFITSKDNYWFAAAFVNRVWGSLMGQAFYMPVDNMGPLQEATYPEVLLRLADGFRATDHDIKGLLRAILNSQAYQQGIRLGPTIDHHVKFAGMYPSKLSGDTLWESLRSVLGPFPSNRPENAKEFTGGAGVTAGPFSKASPTLQYLVKQTFDYDPSLKPDDVEGSITQAMMLMNNKTINSQIKATGDTALARLLGEHQKDDSVIQILYLKALSREPLARELETCRVHLKEFPNRGEAIEDILWVLVNSTEFLTKR